MIAGLALINRFGLTRPFIVGEARSGQGPPEPGRFILQTGASRPIHMIGPERWFGSKDATMQCAVA